VSVVAEEEIGLAPLGASGYILTASPTRVPGGRQGPSAPAPDRARRGGVKPRAARRAGGRSAPAQARARARRQQARQEEGRRRRPKEPHGSADEPGKAAKRGKSSLARRPRPAIESAQAKGRPTDRIPKGGAGANRGGSVQQRSIRRAPPGARRPLARCTTDRPLFVSPILPQDG